MLSTALSATGCILGRAVFLAVSGTNDSLPMQLSTSQQMERRVVKFRFVSQEAGRGRGCPV
jgi:hypothetical protein